MNLKATTLAAAAGAAIAPQAAGATVAAPAATPKHARQYLRAYHAVARRFGHRAPGRNIVRWGLRGHRPSDSEVTRSLLVLQRMLAPPPPTALDSGAVAAGVQSVTHAVAAGAAAISAGSAGLPACASESGTDYSTGASNTNPSSGATGRYQITPGTSAAYGCSLATPAGQDACAAVIYAHQGASAWVGCGG